MNVNKQLLEKYNQAGPRYTSYPPANFFTKSFTETDLIQGLKQSNEQKPDAISVYLHVPFCPQICHFCGCNTNKAESKQIVERYFNAIVKEIHMVAQNLDLNRELTQIHWGGGTPNSVSLSFIKQIMDELKKVFKFSANAEIAMECSPAYLKMEDIDQLAEMGFNRLSLGIQDFDEKILNLVNRKASRLPVYDLVTKIKSAGFQSVNLDFIYGLPGQTVESFTQSIQKAIEIQPDRLVTFSYAHVPWVKDSQKVLEQYHLPTANEKLEMFLASYNLLTTNGYVSIGLDHYAKPEDELSKALENKLLHRNFQGYCTRETTGQVYAFGATSITQLEGVYAQNVKSIFEYMDLVEAGKLPVERGYTLSYEDKVIRTVINEIMCNGYLNFEKTGAEFNLSANQIKEIVQFDESKLQAFERDGLIECDTTGFILKPEGYLFVRNIAMAFDPKLSVKEGMYSKTV